MTELPLKLSRLIPPEEFEAVLTRAGMVIVGRTAVDGGTIVRIPEFLIEKPEEPTV